MGKQYTFNYQVPFYQVDVNHKMRLSSLLSLALQVSGYQSEALGLSDQSLLETYGLVWVVTDYQLMIERLPRYREEILIRTEALSYNRLICYRQFDVLTKTGEKLLTIKASFVLLDYQSRRPHQVLEEIVAPYQAEKIKQRLKVPQFASFTPESKRTFPVLYSDLDQNAHVNNGRYMDWFYDDLPLAFLRNHSPKTIHLSYVKEIQATDQVSSQCSLKGTRSQHCIRSEAGLHAQAEIEWRQNDL
ncbi:acyl-ACP thioesterase domain-containing protein [Streptococcus cuniculipharyngis]|uniref:Acyl-[acyl-carrier-protein] thioesterase n=1 Tax=Streptococcus cuniculipharyngis TaxID=1562651 RepID=A0A5C5SDS8_9STRE|nr:acyl-ACP thioesterase domain-containing protein [Streptococcus cuniculipharyngis]TWS98944.1 acyl-[acyl-carrier-protein] thioesterase [Streptococcus cuniculipharyngis]